MNTNNKDVKPFYIYTDKNCLYMRNINSHTEKLYNNIHAYCVNIDDKKNIHICCIDKLGRLIHLFYSNKHWKKKIVCKAFDNIKNIKNMRLYIVNNFLNTFIVEENPLSEDLNKISHFNFNPKDYKIYRYYINNVLKDNASTYKLNLDGLSNIILQYKLSNTYSREFDEKTLIFNSISKVWLDSSILPKVQSNQTEYTDCNIKEDLFDYCYSIVYKM